jgi:hypothetical protein
LSDWCQRDDNRIYLLLFRTIVFLTHFDEAPQYVVLLVRSRWKLTISIWRTFSLYNCHHLLAIAQYRLGISMKRAAQNLLSNWQQWLLRQYRLINRTFTNVDQELLVAV